MYINNEERKAKIGKINVSASRDNSIKLRFTYPQGVRRDINVCTNTDEGWVNAIRIAQAINADIELGQFDDTLAKYSPKRSQALEIANKQPNLNDLWETYKETSKTRVAETTIKKHWVQYERHYLGRTPKELLDCCDEFIKEFPQGLETVIGENGVNLSGGQRQRLAIARALVRNPRILILDEATASLDTASEASIQEALSRLMKNRTSFVVAHRLSTTRQANRIVVMEKGRIVEVGDRTQLLANNSIFAQLHALQS